MLSSAIHWNAQWSLLDIRQFVHGPFLQTGMTELCFDILSYNFDSHIHNDFLLSCSEKPFLEIINFYISYRCVAILDFEETLYSIVKGCESFYLALFRFHEVLNGQTYRNEILVAFTWIISSDSSIISKQTLWLTARHFTKPRQHLKPKVIFENNIDHIWQKLCLVKQ